MKTKHHEIDLNDFQEWLTEAELVYASSTRERKRLVCTPSGNLKIYIGSSVVWQGMQHYAAVEFYNSLTEMYVPERNRDSSVNPSSVSAED